jgi:hypothetical protein
VHLYLFPLTVAQYLYLVLMRLRPLFHHWKYSGVLIPLFFATGVAMSLADKPGMAYAFFALFGLWTIGYWLTSDWLRKRRRLLALRNTRRDVRRFAEEARKYCAWEWGVSLLILSVSAGFMFWTYQEHREQVRIAAYQGLMLTTGAERNPLDSTFTLTNLSTHDLGKHTMVGTPNMIVGNHGTTVLRSENFGKRGGMHFECEGFEDSLNGGGTSQTYLTCLHNIHMREGIDCVDVTMNVTYRLKEQPDVENRKDFRFASGSKDGFAWHSQPPENPFNYCGAYVTTATPNGIAPAP